MRSSILGVVLGITALAAAPALASGAPRAPGVCGSFAPLPVAFRFGAGAAPVGAATAPDGSVYVGTAEGYVHALRADGSFRWSYTLSGPVVGRPVVGDSGAVFVPTARRVYAIRPDGRLLWVFRSPVRVAGDLARDAQGRLHFASDGRLFALSGRGALVAHVPGRVPLSSQPVAVGDGVGAGRADGGVVLATPRGVARFAVGSAVRAVLGCPGARLCALTDGGLEALGGPGSDFRVPAIAAAASEGWLAVLHDRREISVFYGAERQKRYRVRLPEPASAGLAVAPSGRVSVPLVSGALLAFESSGVVGGCAELGPATLATPLVDAVNRRLIVLSREGLVASVGLE